MEFVLGDRTILLSEAIREFWAIRDAQAKRQQDAGVSDQGARSSVTGGQQMNGFAAAITSILIDSGVAPASIYRSRMPTDLPGFYRPTKQWDIVVILDGRLLAAIELKSQVGPSFGNNFNNRTEEAVGSAADIWTAYREGAFGASPQPWLGYLFLLEDCVRSRLPVVLREPHFGVLPEFQGTSYAQRYELLCRKLVRERQYNAACFLMADRSRALEVENYWEPASDLSARTFITGLVGATSTGG